MNVTVVKLGGSLITRKGGNRSLRTARVARIAEEFAAVVAKGPRRFLVGHGSGSFGHVAAHEHGIHRGRGGAAGLSATQAAAAELHQRMLAAFRGAGIATYSVTPSSCVVGSGARAPRVNVEPLERALDAGLLVLTYGDVIMDRVQGHAICSTERALVAMARSLKRRGARLRGAYWFGDTDGIYDEAGATISRLDRAAARRVRQQVGQSGATDVTGGMRHRLDAALEFARLGVRSWILDGSVAGSVHTALVDKPRGGTRFDV